MNCRGNNLTNKIYHIMKTTVTKIVIISEISLYRCLLLSPFSVRFYNFGYIFVEVYVFFTQV